MASPAVSTPIRSHKGLFSTRVAGGRMPLTPSPRTRTSSNVNRVESSPIHTPEKYYDPSRAGKSVYGGNLASHFAKGTSRAPRRDSPKSNIARCVATPRKALELGVSDFNLIGTGHAAKDPSSKKSQAPIRPRANKTTLTYTADRFIPNRSNSSAIAHSGSGKLDLQDRSRPKSAGNTDSSSILTSATDAAIASLEGLSLHDDDDDAARETRPSPGTVAYKNTLADACGVNLGTRILEFKPAPPESSKPIDLRQQYNRPLKSASATSAQFKRRVATAPERVLDAPGLIDDYYLNLLDWSSGNQVAIGLERNVYVWSADEGSVSCLMEATPDTYVSSVKWSDDGAYVSVGLGSGEVQIWDVAEGTKTRSMFGHDSRVGVMGWNKHLLSTGAQSGLVFNHDVRIADHKVAELVSHRAEVCGLEWRSDGAQLATGGNDNLVSIWDARSLAVPKFSKTNHKAAVKALAWCPWNMNLLATGGGTADRNIHFWNTTSGTRVNSIDTGSQVTSLRWSTGHREIVSTSGFPDNSLSIWTYPTLVRHVEIPAHESRVLHSCLSKDGQILATAAADESLKFWKLFDKKPAGAVATSRKAQMAQQMTIR